MFKIARGVQDIILKTQVTRKYKIQIQKGDNEVVALLNFPMPKCFQF